VENVSLAGGTADMGASEFLVSNLVFAKTFKFTMASKCAFPFPSF